MSNHSEDEGAATRRFKNPITGEVEDAVVVDIAHLENSPIIVSLCDGAKIRITFDIFEATRFPTGQDIQGYPPYHLRWGTSIVVVDGPSETESCTE